MKLSILIPSIPSRSKQLALLMDKLRSQVSDVRHKHPMIGEVEVLIDDSVSFLDGGKSVGQKRDDLIQRAEGDYLCFLDDDDTIAPNYIETLLRAAASDADVITFNSIFKCDTYWTLIDMSYAYANEEATPEGIVRRCAWHICPIKSGIAKSHRFTNKNNAEDWDWMERVLKDITSEHKLNIILHQYNHSANVSEVDRIERQ